MQNMYMLPFEGRKFVLSYVAALGAYAFLTKTAMLLAVVLAVSAWSWVEILGSMLCAANGALMAAAVFSLNKYQKRYRYAGCLWAAASVAGIFLLRDALWFLPMAADGIFLCSWQLQVGGVTVLMAVTAVFFALQSAVFSVLLEWFYPLRGWKIESDLWHHPRKYVVPAAMFLLAGVVSTILGTVAVQ